MRIWIRNTAFFLANLRFCDFRTGTPRKCADLQFADWHTSEICGIYDCGMSPRICGFAICGRTRLLIVYKEEEIGLI
jgi:hypothetical protein